MKRVLKIGAPSLMGEGARQTVEQVFGDAEFPLPIIVTNRFPCNMTVAELGGVHLAPVGNAHGLDRQQCVVKDKDLMVRVVSSMEQVSENNKIPHSMTFESVEEGSGSDGEGGGNDDGEQQGESEADEPDENPVTSKTKATKARSGKAKK